MSVDAWHFAASTLRDGSPLPAAGIELPEIADLEPCARGYHGSVQPLDALAYAPGPMVARVRLHGVVIASPPDKICASRRCGVTGYVDANEVLREFTRWCALSVAQQWDMPPQVREYLTTGDKSMREAAWAATRDATRDATRHSAWSVAKHAAKTASKTAAVATASDAAWDAAWNAAIATAWDAAWDAALAAAWDASWDAARGEQNARLDAALIDITTASGAPS